MTDKKITELTEITTLLETDFFLLQRDDSNIKVRADNFVAATAEVPEKSIFYNNGVNQTNVHAGKFTSNTGGSSSRVFMSFFIPFDFTSLVSLNLIWIPNWSTPDGLYSLGSDYSLDGEAFNINSQVGFFDLVLTSGQIKATDLAPVFSNIEAGHSCGMMFDVSGFGSVPTPTGSSNYLGVELIYR